MQLIDGEILAECLAGMDQAVTRKVARESLRAGGGPMLAAIKSRIHDVTGLLRSSLKLRVGRGDWPGRFSVYLAATTTRKRFAAAKPQHRVAAGGERDRYRVYYAPMVEFGHARPGSGRAIYKLRAGQWRYWGRNEGRVEAHPFMRPGFEATVGEAGTIIETTLIDAIDREW